MLHIIKFNQHHDLIGVFTVLNPIWREKETSSEYLSDACHLAGRGKKQISKKKKKKKDFSGPKSLHLRKYSVSHPQPFFFLLL